MKLKNLPLHSLRSFLVGMFMLASIASWSQVTNRQPLPFTFENTTGFSDDEVFVAIVGEDLSAVPGVHIYVDCKTGEQHPMDRSKNTIPGPVYVWLGDPNEGGIPARNSSEGNRNPDGTAMYADCFTKLSEIPDKTVLLKPLQGCRVFVAAREQLYLFFHGATGSPSGYSAPSPTDPTDPNQGILFEMIELTYDQWGYFANTTRVDSYRYPMGMEVWGNDTLFVNPRLPRPELTDPSNIKQVGVYKKVGEHRTHEEIVNAFKAFAPEEFLGCLDEETGEIKAPSKTRNFADGSVGTMPTPGIYVDYLQPYIDAIWSKYASEDLIFYTGDAGYWKGRVQGDKLVVTSMSIEGGPFYGRTAIVDGKPTTQEVLEGKGLLDNVVNDRVPDLMIQAQLCAAINRHVVDVTTPGIGLQYWDRPSEFYQEGPANFYSKFWHLPSISLDGRSYGFCYDDVWDQSSSCPTLHPTKVVVTFGGYAGENNDSIAPTTPTNLEATATSTSVTLTWTASTDETALEGYSIYQDGVLLGFTTNTTYTISNLSQLTTYTFAVEAKDAGNNKSGLASVSIATLSCGDSTAPSTVSDLHFYTTDNSIQASWTAATDNVEIAGYELLLNGAILAQVNALTYTFISLSPATNYVIDVVAIDGCGNRSDVVTQNVSTKALAVCTGTSTGSTGTSFSWIGSADKTNPSITFVPGQGVGSGVCVIHYKVNNGAEQNVNVGMNAPFVVEATEGQTISFYYTYARAEGGEDNNVNDPASFTVGQCAPGDDTAPSIPTGFAATTFPESVDLNWIASTDNDPILVYNVYNGATLVGTTQGTTFSVSGLAYNTTYTFFVDAADQAGNTSGKAQVTATTTTCNDTQAPTTPATFSGNATTSSIALSWSASSDNNTVLGYYVFQNGVLIETTAQLSANVTGLNANTTYNFTLVAYDACGNLSAEKALSKKTQALATCSGMCNGLSGTSFSWTASSETTNPSITFIPETGVGSGLCILHYTVGNGAQQNVSVSMNQAYQIQATAGQTVNFYYTYARAAGGEDNNMNDIATFTVGACGPQDQNPPTTPSITSATPSSSTIALTWSASTDDVEMDGYAIYLNGALVATTSNTSYTYTNLSEYTEYLVAVEAVDAAGNVSAQSTQYVYTTYCTDTQSPSAPSNITSQPSTDSVVLNWAAASDNVGVVGYDIYNGATLVASTSSASTTVTNLVAGTTYSYTLYAKDACQNISNAVTITFTTEENLVCSGISNGITGSSFQWVVDEQGASPTITFVAGNGVGTGTCILHYTINNGGSQNVAVSMGQPYSIAANTNDQVEFYYTYALAAGGEDNNMNDRVNFVIGNCVVSSKKADKVVANIPPSISVYPNPVSTTLTIQSGNYELSSATLIDNSGRVVSQHALNTRSEQVIDLSGLKNGVYFVRILSANKVFVRQIIKQ